MKTGKAYLPNERGIRRRTVSIAYPTVSTRLVGDRGTDSRFDATVLSQFSEGYPARIEITFTNTATEEREVRFGGPPPFFSYKSDSDGSDRLVLIPDDNSHIVPTESSRLVPRTPTDGCWTVLSGFAVYGSGVVKSVSPQETLSQQYTVLNHWANVDCLPPGEYVFEQPAPASHGDRVTVLVLLSS